MFEFIVLTCVTATSATQGKPVSAGREFAILLLSALPKIGTNKVWALLEK